MSPKQIEHFKKILLDWKNLLMKEAEKTVENMKRDSTKLSDPNDAATQEEEFRLELRTRDRERKLIIKIDQALRELMMDYTGTARIQVSLLVLKD